MIQLGGDEVGKAPQQRQPRLFCLDPASVGYTGMPIIWMNSAKPYRTRRGPGYLVNR